MPRPRESTRTGVQNHKRFSRLKKIPDGLLGFGLRFLPWVLVWAPGLGSRSWVPVLGPGLGSRSWVPVLGPGLLPRWALCRVPGLTTDPPTEQCKLAPGVVTRARRAAAARAPSTASPPRARRQAAGAGARPPAWPQSAHRSARRWNAWQAAATSRACP